MTARLENKVAIVTGAAQGIGLAISRAFAAEGASVMLGDVNEATINAAAAEITARGAKAKAIRCDVRDANSVKQIVAGAVDKFGGLDIVVNSAGITRDMAMFKMTEDDWDSVVDIALKGSFMLTQAATGWMVPQAKKEREAGGESAPRKIINITSGAVRGNVGQANYSAAKAGIIGLTRANAREFGKYNILVNAICPVALSPMTAHLKEPLEKATMLGRVGDVDKDIAPVFVFLASAEANYITGQIIGVNGGLDTQY
ncbi:SDR family NAD(P)-dependent oxidoreductase [Chloroflexota bacterium]